MRHFTFATAFTAVFFASAAALPMSGRTGPADDAVTKAKALQAETDWVLGRMSELGVDGPARTDIWHLTQERDEARDALAAARAAFAAAQSNLLETCRLNGVVERPKAPAAKKGKSQAEKDIEEMRRQIASQRGRYEVLKRTLKKWGPHTNLNVRAARQTMQDRLDETRAERDAAKAYEKMVKEVRKNAEKDAKNAGKLREDIEKYRDKAETEAFRSLCSGLLDAMGGAE